MVGAWNTVTRFGRGYAWPTSVPLGVTATLASIELGAAKITGTGAGGDLWLLRVAGANQLLDFTDAGFASTFGPTIAEIEDVFAMLNGNLTHAGVEICVLEIADGFLQRETSMLLTSELFCRSVDGISFTSGDAVGASAGVELLRERHLPVLALSSTLTTSPLASREVEGRHPRGGVVGVDPGDHRAGS